MFYLCPTEILNDINNKSNYTFQKHHIWGYIVRSCHVSSPNLHTFMQNINNASQKNRDAEIACTNKCQSD